MVNSKQKGSAGERELAKFFRDHGYEDARRTQQYCGTEGTSDVLCESFPINHHIECKRVEKLNIEKALVQAETDCEHVEQIPIVFHRSNKTEWKVTMRADEYIKIIKGYDG